MAGYDVVVIGLGATGSAALLALARRRQRVLGIERFTPGHDRGSSHGETRIFRVAYFEHPSYVPLLHEAYGLWRELEAASGRKLLTTTGIVEIGPPDGELLRGTLASSRLHGLTHEMLDARELARRFPAFAVPRDFAGVFQPDGGFLAAEPAVAAQLDLAIAEGANIQTNMKVEAIEPREGGVRIVTAAGIVDAGVVIVAAGPWLKTLLPNLRLPIRVTRQVQGWITPPSPAQFSPDRFPVFLFESMQGLHYGFPIHGTHGLKLARHHHLNETVDPETCDRTVSQRDKDAILAFRDAFLPGATGPLTAATTCLYTMTPDGHFILDRFPNAGRVIVASPCSGHGFKFAPVVGEILAELATAGTTQRDITRFSLARFG